MDDVGTSQPGVVELASRLIKFPSVTAIEGNQRASASDCLDDLQTFFETSGALCNRMLFEGGHDRWDYPVDNLCAEWGNTLEADFVLCFIGHSDVVAPGDEKAWDLDPFSGVVENGYLYGRGATDMKGAIASFAVAIAEFQKNPNWLPDKLAVSMVITADEEWAAVNGTRKVLGWMKENGRSPDAFIVGEPSSDEYFGSSIKVGRRGSLCGTIQSTGVQGHTAYPDLFENPNRGLSLALAVLQTKRWSDGNQAMSATGFEPVAITSGELLATSIIPNRAVATWNVRFTPAHEAEDVARELEQLLAYPPSWAESHPDSDFLRNVELIANIDTVSNPYYSDPADFALAAQVVVQSRTRHPVLFDSHGGTSDGRFVHSFFPNAQIIELGLPEAGGLTRRSSPDNFGKAGGMHQPNECCAVADLELLMSCYHDILLYQNEL